MRFSTESIILAAAIFALPALSAPVPAPPTGGRIRGTQGTGLSPPVFVSNSPGPVQNGPVGTRPGLTGPVPEGRPPPNGAEFGRGQENSQQRKITPNPTDTPTDTPEQPSQRPEVSNGGGARNDEAGSSSRIPPNDGTPPNDGDQPSPDGQEPPSDNLARREVIPRGIVDTALRFLGKATNVADAATNTVAATKDLQRTMTTPPTGPGSMGNNMGGGYQGQPQMGVQNTPTW